MNDSQETTTPTLHDHLSRAGKLGAAAQPHEAKVAGGIAGAKSRWANRPLCPACGRGATKAQIKSKQFIRSE